MAETRVVRHTLAEIELRNNSGDAMEQMRRQIQGVGSAVDIATKQFDQFRAMQDVVAQSATTTAMRLRESDREWKAIERSIPGTTAALERFNTISKQADAALAAGRISAEQHTAAITKLRAKYVEAGDAAPKLGAANENVAKSSKLAAHEVTNLSYQLQDAAVQLAGGQSPFLILMQQGPQATGAVGGVGRAIALLATPTGIAIIGFTALAGAAALVGTRAASIDAQTRGLTVSMKAYGTEAQATAQQLRAVATALYEGGASRDESLATTKVLAWTRGISGAMGKQLAGLGSDMAAGLGQTVDETVKQLATLATEGYPAIKKLQDSIGFLTADEVKAVRTAAEHGEQAKALGIALEALHRRFDGLREQSMSPTGKAMHELGVGWNRFMDAVAESRPVMDTIANLSGAVTRMSNAVSSTPQQKVADLKAELDDLYKRRESRDQAKASGKNYVGLFSVWDLFGAKDGADLDRQIKDAEGRLAAAQRHAVETLQSGNRPRVAGTSAGAASAGGKVDEKALEYVDEQTAAYERLAGAMAGNRAQRVLNMAAMKAENEIRDRHLQGDDAEQVRILRRNEAMLELSASYRDGLENLSLTAQGNMKLADAYGISEAAAIRQKAANDAMATAAGNAAVNVAELTKQNVAATAAASAEDLSKRVADLQREVKLQQDITDAAGRGMAARAEAERKADVARATSTALATAQAAEKEGAVDLAVKLRALAGAYDGVSAKAAGLSKLQALKGYANTQQEELETLRLRREMVFSNDAERNIAMARLKAEQFIRNNIDLTKELNEQEKTAVEHIRRQALETAHMQNEVTRVEDATEFPDEVTEEFGTLIMEALS